MNEYQPFMDRQIKTVHPIGNPMDYSNFIKSIVSNEPMPLRCEIALCHLQSAGTPGKHVLMMATMMMSGLLKRCEKKSIHRAIGSMYQLKRDQLHYCTASPKN